MHVVAALLLLVAFASAKPATDPTLCEHGPCQNGGSCFPKMEVTEYGKKYTCLCRGDYGGLNCQIADPCSTCPKRKGQIVYCQRTSLEPAGRICMDATTLEEVRSLIETFKRGVPPTGVTPSGPTGVPPSGPPPSGPPPSGPPPSGPPPSGPPPSAPTGVPPSAPTQQSPPPPKSHSPPPPKSRSYFHLRSLPQKPPVPSMQVQNSLNAGTHPLKGRHPLKAIPQLPTRLPGETDEQYQIRLEEIFETKLDELLSQLPQLPARLPNETDEQFETRLAELVHLTKMLRLNGYSD